MRIFDWVLGGRDIHQDVAEPGADSLLVKLEPAYWRKLMNRLPRIVADNAQEYVDREYTKRGRAIDLDWGKTVLLPPFDDVWMESIGTGRHADCPDYISLNFGFRVRRLATDQGHTTRIGPVLIHSIYQGAEYVVVMHYHWDMYLNEVGVCQDVLAYKTADESPGASALLGVPVIALDWINGRNIELVEHAPSDEQQRKWRKRNMPIGSSYLQIEIGSKYRKQWEGQSGGVSATRFHTVAGSWATYGAEKPRFGRHRPEDIGRFWRRGSAAGDKSLGVINKEYRVTDETE